MFLNLFDDFEPSVSYKERKKKDSYKKNKLI